jgi:hypothetical protein
MAEYSYSDREKPKTAILDLGENYVGDRPYGPIQVIIGGAISISYMRREFKELKYKRLK